MQCLMILVMMNYSKRPFITENVYKSKVILVLTEGLNLKYKIVQSSLKPIKQFTCFCNSSLHYFY